MEVLNQVSHRTDEFPCTAKSSALHVENTTSLVRDFVKTSVEARPILASVAEITSADSSMTTSAAASSKSVHGSVDTSEAELSRSHEPLAPTSSQETSRATRAPPPLRQYQTEPTLWIKDGPDAGHAAAEWKEKFIPIIRDHTAQMSTTERTEFFDELINDDKERYLAPLAAYYYVHREHLPDRELSFKALKKIEMGHKEDTRIAARQTNVFRDWSWNPGRPAAVKKESVGPKNETITGDIPECEHCVRKAKRSKLRKRATLMLAPVLSPFRRGGVAMQHSSHRTTQIVQIEAEATGSINAVDEKATDDSDATSSPSGSSTRARRIAGQARASTLVLSTQPPEVKAQ